MNKKTFYSLLMVVFSVSNMLGMQRKAVEAMISRSIDTAAASRTFIPLTLIPPTLTASAKVNELNRLIKKYATTGSLTGPELKKSFALKKQILDQFCQEERSEPTQKAVATINAQDSDLQKVIELSKRTAAEEDQRRVTEAQRRQRAKTTAAAAQARANARRRRAKRRRGGIPKSTGGDTRGTAARRTQTSNHFVAKLVQSNTVVGREQLQDGSCVIQIKSANQGDSRIPKQLTGATCALFAIRNSQLMLNYVLTEKIEYAKRLINTADATKFLEPMKVNLEDKISDLSGESIDKLLQSNALASLDGYEVAIAANNTNTVVIENPKHVAQLHLRMRSTIEEIEEKTIQKMQEDGQAVNREEVHRQIEAIKRLEIQKLIEARFTAQMADIKTRIARLNNGAALAFVYNTGGHWISISVAKKDDKLYWFVINSGRGNFIPTAKQFIQRIASN